MPNDKLLIVDDEEVLLDQLKSYFQRKGYIVSTASKGEDALSLIKENDPALMILDLHLEEGLQGIDVLKQALEFKPGLKIVIVTGFGKDKDTVDMCLGLGAKTVLAKPIDLGALKAELENLQKT